LREYYDLLKQKGASPTTSTPSAKDYEDVFAEIITSGEDVLCFTITDDYSSSYQSALIARKNILEKYPSAKIYILNSKLVTGLQRLLVISASKMQSQGKSMEFIVKECIKMQKTGRIFFMIGTLDHLLRGGRMAKLFSLSGNLLNIKPIIRYRYKDLGIRAIVRSRKKGLLKIIDQTLNYFLKTGESIKDYLFIVGSVDAMEDAKSFKTLVAEKLGYPEFEECFYIGPTISSHTGPGTIGVGFIKKYNL